MNSFDIMELWAAQGKLAKLLEQGPKISKQAIINDTDTVYHRFDDLWAEVTRVLTTTYFIDAEKAERLCVELFRGLVCKSSFEDSLLLSFSPQVDLAWHQAILNTGPYGEMCNQVFGYIMPHTTKTSQDNLITKNQRVASTELVYKKLFKEKPPADLWERERVVIQSKRKKRKNGEENEIEEISEEEEYDIFIKTMTAKTVTMRIVSSIPISVLKGLIFMDEGIPSSHQRLMLAGKQLEDHETCGAAGVSREMTLHLCLRLTGC
jgi:hypothetical protein